MRRREFISLLGGAAASWPTLGKAQPAQRIWRVGMLVATSMRGPSAPYFTSFKEEMRALGYIEGRNIIFATREAEGNFERLPALARELILDRPEVISGNYNAFDSRRSQRDDPDPDRNVPRHRSDRQRVR